MRSQALSPLEIVVVDDGSTDQSQRIAREAGARVVEQRPLGLSAARNRGVEEARGELIAFCDADDRMTPLRLRTQLEYLNCHPEVAGVVGMMRLFATRTEGEIAVDVFEEPMVGRCGSALLVRREFYLASGGMDVDLQAGEFIDWMVRCLDQQAIFGTVDEVVLERRVHDQNMTREVEKIHREYLAVVRKNLLRRRSEGILPPNEATL